MSPQTAALVFAVGILVLFALDRDRDRRRSIALWIPVVWLSIGGSRMVSQWLQIAPEASADQFLEGSSLDRNILLALTVAGTIVLLRRGQKVGPLLRVNGPILLFFLYCLASVAWSDYPYVTFKRWTKACGDLVMVLIVLSDPDPNTAVKQLLARVGFLLIPISILLIKYYNELGRAYGEWTYEVTVTGVTTGKNMLGMLCFVYGLGAMWRLLPALRAPENNHRTGPLIAHGALLSMALWLFWKANSMTALVCFLMASVLLVATSLSRAAMKPSAVHLLVVTLLSISGLFIFLDVGSSVLTAIGRDPTLTGRTQLWDDTLKFAGNPVFGTGFESFWLGDRLKQIWAIYWWHPNEAHNGYLELFLSLGFLGLTLFALIIVTGYRNILTSLRQDPDMGRLKLAFFVTSLAYNFTESTFKMMSTIWVFFLIAVIIVPKPSVPKVSRQFDVNGSNIV